MKHFIYIYLDPNKPGEYKYGDLEFDYEPFYIGKGKDKRWKPEKHICNSRYLINKINKIGPKNIIIEMPFVNIFEKVANKYEKRLIKEIGRKDLNKGPLLNMTDGGEGNSGRMFSKEHREKLSKANMGNSHPGFWEGKEMPQWARDKMSKARKGKIPWNRGLKGLPGHKITREEREKISKANSGINNGMATLNEKQVKRIRELYKEGFSFKEIAIKLKIKKGVTYGVTSGRTYKNVL
jgi:NUMOD3 motif-containing protein